MSLLLCLDRLKAGLAVSRLICRYIPPQVGNDLRRLFFVEVLNMDDMTPNEGITKSANPGKGYLVTIGRDIIRVISVFSGTKTASEAIHDAAVKKILYDKTAG